jgi:hypothetical protein
MARLLGHRQTKGSATDKVSPTATAPPLYSTLGSPAAADPHRQQKIHELVPGDEAPPAS